MSQNPKIPELKEDVKLNQKINKDEQEGTGQQRGEPAEGRRQPVAARAGAAQRGEHPGVHVSHHQKLLT